jgi:hypothetical protein
LFSQPGLTQQALLAYLKNKFDLVPRQHVAIRSADPLSAPEPSTTSAPPPPPPASTTTTEAPKPPPTTQSTTQSPSTELPSSTTAASIITDKPTTADPIAALKERLLTAIQSNPEAAAVAAAAIRDAAKASGQQGGNNSAALATLSGFSDLFAPGLDNRLKRRVKRQAAVAARVETSTQAAVAAGTGLPKYSWNLASKYNSVD